MGYLLIVLGIAAIIGGVVILSHHNESGNTVQIANHIERNDTIPNSQNQMHVSASESATTEVVTVEKEVIVEKEVAVSDENKEKGNAFEDFVVNLLADHRLLLLDRTQDAVSTAGVVAESCKNPDLHVQQKRGNGKIDYYFECKYRSRWFNDIVTLNEWQLKRYRQFQRENRRKVIIALGVGGTPTAPETLRLVPLDSIHNSTIRKIDTQYAVAANSQALVDYMDDYFTSVFEAKRK